MDFSFANLAKIPLGNGNALGLVLSDTAPASAVWPAANRAVYLPFTIEAPTTVYAVSVYVGAAVAGNLDIGVYTFDGRKLFSTAAVDTTGWDVNTLKTVAVNPQVLTRGRFYVGASASSATLQLFRSAPAGVTAATGGLLQQASAHPLPATATFATISSAFYPCLYLHTKDTSS